MRIISNTGTEKLANRFIEDILAEENFNESFTKSGFLTGGNMLICESEGLQEYLQKTCVDKHGIWAALPFKPLVRLLMQCAYNLSKQKKDEKESIFNQSNLVWAIYSLLKDKQKTFTFASEIASLFFAYQIYRPEIIEKWNKNEQYAIKESDDNFKKNEKFQRELWVKLKTEYNNEQDISQLYNFLINELKSNKHDKSFLPKQIFIFAPLSVAPIHLSVLSLLAEAGCKVNLYLLQISKEYIGDSKSEKTIANMRKKSWAENKIAEDGKLYWDLGNRLIANLGRSAQVLYEQIGWDNLEYIDEAVTSNSLLKKIQEDIINDNNAPVHPPLPIPNSLTLNNCFSPLREIEVLHDYILDLFTKNKNLTPEDIAIVSPNIENYASSIETVFGRANILPYKISDRDIKKSDKTVQLLNLLFAQIGSRYEASDAVALFEYSMSVQGRELETGDRERLEKWVIENAIRHGLEKPQQPLPNYSFKSGFEQLAAGFFMLSETEFSEIGQYCYPDIEGSSAEILGEFICFIETLQKFEEASLSEKSIKDWDFFFRENLQIFFGTDETNFNEDKDNPYQKIIGTWDSLKKEMLVGFGGANILVNFSVLKIALPKKLESNAKSSYSLSGRISCSNLETVRAVPRKVICCVGMNSKEFPHQVINKDISLMPEYKLGDKDTANEERLMFLEMLLSAREMLYISWVGQSEKTAEELEPSGVVVMLLKNLKEQYGIETENFITKHPLQPFSIKYFDSDLKTCLKTYDNRWQATGINAPPKSIWKWQIAPTETEEKRNINDLYKILSDAPKYFLRTVCNIELPEEIELLEDLEPFIVEKGLEEWILADLILNYTDYEKKINIFRFRGKLPSGKFADNAIEEKIKQVKAMQKLEDENVKTFIKPSKDCGKYRLWHWLQHLEYNKIKSAATDIILLNEKREPIKIRLAKLEKEAAEKNMENLWILANELKTRMQPIFPNAAWEYKNSGKIEAAEKTLFDAEFNSQYAKIVIENAKSFAGLGIENDFIKRSKQLFENYSGVEIK